MLILGYNTDFTLQDNIQTIDYNGNGIMILMGTLSVGVFLERLFGEIFILDCFVLLLSVAQAF